MKKVMVLGEILWDCVGEIKTAAGAPFNFAKHLLQNEISPILVSAVGRDESGTALKSKAEQCGFVSHVQVNNCQTGFARVSSQNGRNAFELANPAAWDFIELTPEFEQAASSVDAIYFGTLAQRNSISQNTIRALANQAKLRLCDINLRPPFDDRDVILWSIRNCEILKLSAEETPTIAQILGCPVDLVHSRIFESSPVQILVESRGANGAKAFHRNGQTAYAPAPSVKIRSTVGAGDAFFASFAAHILNNKNLSDAVDNAVNYASSMCR